MPPGRSQYIATCLNLMGDWRDSVRSQQSEKTDAVRVCRKAGGWELDMDAILGREELVLPLDTGPLMGDCSG